MPRPRFDLFLVSGLILFLELACIRWFPAHVLFLTFFTNTVLLACFVGMSVGCLAARSKTDHLARTPAVLAVALGVGTLLHLFKQWVERFVDVGNQSRPEVIFFGAEAGIERSLGFFIPIEVMAGLMFVLIAAVFVGPGQELGRAFLRVPQRATAYALDLAGSLAGIVLFALGSWLELPPVVWFAVAAAGVLYLLRRPGAGPVRVAFPAVCLALGVALTVRTSGVLPDWATPPGSPRTTWSPYYRVDHQPADGSIITNLIGHQVMESREEPGHERYHLPYLLNREAGRPAPKRILVIGSGSGNDVSRALVWAAPDARIDAVDIEPAIQRIGRDKHPDRPYADPRVTFHLDDGRNFLRRAPEGEYDLVVYALVDSLVLHSGYGSIRLESYLFTEQAFADVRRVLKPSGAFALYNYFRHGWLAARLRNALRAEFGAEPLTLTDPPTAGNMKLDQFVNLFTFFLAGRDDVISPIRNKFAGGRDQFWVPGNEPIHPDTRCRFSAAAPGRDTGAAAATEWVGLPLAGVEDDQGTVRPATDEWPFLYTRRPSVPGYILRGIGLMVALALLLGFVFRPRPAADAPVEAGPRVAPPDDRALLARAFLLGAGFMLIETKAVVQMALLFGSTWAVNTVVFAAILVMALLGNTFAAVVKPTRLWPYYVGLFAALGLNAAVPLDAFLGLDRAAQVVAASALVFAPVLFAGVIFPVSFARAPRPDRFFGANVAGSLFGGLAENLSMLVGFRYLVLVALVAYAASGLFNASSRTRRNADLEGQATPG